MIIGDVPKEAIGFRLYRIDKRDDLIPCEMLKFQPGAIDTTLRRAAISGRVEVGGDIKDHFADLYDETGDTCIATVALDAKSYNALKNHWARCKVDRELYR